MESLPSQLFFRVMTYDRTIYYITIRVLLSIASKPPF